LPEAVRTFEPVWYVTVNQQRSKLNSNIENGFT